MNRIGAIILLFVISMTVTAQDKTTRIKEIRQAYAEAKQDIAGNGSLGNPRMDMTIHVNDGTEVSEDFIINEERELHFFFKRLHAKADTDLFEPGCYFLTENWSANGHTSYREMLFDPFTHHLLFSYMRTETHAGFVMESRYYYDDLGQLIEEKHKANDQDTTADGQSWSSGGGDQTMGMAYIMMFNDLMKQSETQADSYTPEKAANKDSQIKLIRSLYADAKQKTANDAKSAIPRNMQIEINDQADPETPQQKNVINCWFEYIENVDGAKCYFMTSTCELGDHHVYSEYLFNPRDSQLLFCFSQQKQNDGPSLEWRYYFDNTGRCIEANGREAKNGPGFSDKNAAKYYLEVFNAFVNPSN